MTTWTNTPPTEPGWYYYAEKGKWSAVEVWQDISGRLSISDVRNNTERVGDCSGEFVGRVPDPGTTFTADEVKTYLEGHLDLVWNIRNANLEDAIRFIDDAECGLAAGGNKKEPSK